MISRSKEWNNFAQSNTGIVGSNLNRGMMSVNVSSGKPPDADPDGSKHVADIE